MATATNIKQGLYLPLPVVPTGHSDDRLWTNYREEWLDYSKHYSECLTRLWHCHPVWPDGHTKVDVKVVAWSSLREAWHDYNKATGAAIPEWDCLAAAKKSYTDASNDAASQQERPWLDTWLTYFKAWLDYRDAWIIHWSQRGQPWRIEPEIDQLRIDTLEKWQRRPEDQYPFAGKRLSRADVEWLLATREVKDVDGHPVAWLRLLATWSPYNAVHPNQGLDLRGADLHEVNLCRLPLIELRGGLSGEEWRNAPPGQRKAAAMNLEGAFLRRTSFQAASLRSANLKHARMEYAHLEQAALRGADLTAADLRSACVNQATSLDNAQISKETCVADVSWDDSNLGDVRWPEILGDETRAQELEERREQGREDQEETLKAYHEAANANHQLSVALRAQGLHKDADYFAYRTEKNQQTALWLHVCMQIDQLVGRPRLGPTWLSRLLYTRLAPGEPGPVYLAVLSAVSLVIAFVLQHIGIPQVANVAGIVLTIASALSACLIIIYGAAINCKIRLALMFAITAAMSISTILFVTFLTAWVLITHWLALLFIFSIIAVLWGVLATSHTGCSEKEVED